MKPPSDANVDTTLSKPVSWLLASAENCGVVNPSVLDAGLDRFQLEACNAK